ncbi:hypothetical protein JW921_07600, partial [Candidatus Fermentibacterales bacterium]|nr:hypothetical protein [Candidatus Fermentibacterales bacterium]
MLGKLSRLLLGDRQRKNISALQPYVAPINDEHSGLLTLTDEQLRERTALFRRRLAAGETPDDIMVEAFATVKEACRRMVGRSWQVTGHDLEWNMVPFDVQLIGAVVLHQGRIAEMATGEGKTLVAVMPLYLNALVLSGEWIARASELWGDDPSGWTFEPIPPPSEDGGQPIPVGAGAHLVTVNDYLALRDSQWMGRIFEMLGLTVGCIQTGMTPDERRAQYDCDVTYGTNNEFGFDYLRDNMAVRLRDRVQRGHHFAIVDEVDSVLVDEARTPLIISGPVGRTSNRYKEYRNAIAGLVSRQRDLVSQIVAR